jgi:hypothetical protein
VLVETEVEVDFWLDEADWDDEPLEEELDVVPPGARNTYAPATTIRMTTTPRAT